MSFVWILDTFSLDVRWMLGRCVLCVRVVFEGSSIGVVWMLDIRSAEVREMFVVRSIGVPWGGDKGSLDVRYTSSFTFILGYIVVPPWVAWGAWEPSKYIA